MTLTAKQLIERKSGLGGSDAAAALGLSPWVTPRELYEQKISEQDELDDVATSGPMLWGNLLEPVIRQRYADLTGRIVRVPDTLRSEQHPWMLAHLDGITDCGRGVEIKTARSADGWGEPGTDQIPQAYLLQVQHCMIVARVEVFDVCVLIGGNEERMYEVHQDRELQQLLVDGEAEFWSHVVNRQPPEIDFNADSALELVRRLFPGTDGTTRIASDTHETWRIVMEEAQEFADRYTKVANGAKAHLLHAMGESSLLKFADGYALRRQRVTRKGYSVPESTYVDARMIRAKE